VKVNQKKLLMFLVCGLSLICLVGSASANLVVNGGFEDGNTGFTSTYLYVSVPGSSALYDPATYTVSAAGETPNSYHSSWASFGPYEGDRMMIVNGATSTGEKVWAEAGLGPVTPNITYYFSFWIASVYSVAPAKLSFSINNVNVGSPITASATVGDWQQFYVTWNSGTNTSVDLAEINLNIAFTGNDFALDKIVFDDIPVPLPPSAMLLGSGLLGLVGLGWRRRKVS
jgi:hypothetical protein